MYKGVLICKWFFIKREKEEEKRYPFTEVKTVVLHVTALANPV